MRAMILAAGRGSRLQPLTDHCPKPLVKVGGKPLIEYHLENCARAGIKEVVINLSYLGNQIRDYLGNGQKWGLSIKYSMEPEPLEVGGGIFKALSLLGNEPFILLNGDIWTDYPLQTLTVPLRGVAHLVLTDNPPQHPTGDFYLGEEGTLSREGQGEKYTYTGIAVMSPLLFAGCNGGHFPLAPLLSQAIGKGQLFGEHYAGDWMDIGAYDRWQYLDNRLNQTQLRVKPSI